VAPRITVSGLPTVDEAFGHSTQIRKALHQAHITSLVPLMLLPREALMDIPGIGSTAAHRISRTLARLGLGHHGLCEKMSEFIDKQFGCIEDAPVSVLQVAITRTMDATVPVYAPLELVYLIESLEQDYVVGDLTMMPGGFLRAMVENTIDNGFMVHDLDEDFKHLGSRLGYFGLELMLDEFEEAGQLDQSQPHLRLVASQ